MSPSASRSVVGERGKGDEEILELVVSCRLCVLARLTDFVFLIVAFSRLASDYMSECLCFHQAYQVYVTGTAVVACPGTLMGFRLFFCGDTSIDNSLVKNASISIQVLAPNLSLARAFASPPPSADVKSRIHWVYFGCC